MSEIISTIEDIMKSGYNAPKQHIPTDFAIEPKSYFIDPTNILTYVGSKAKPSPVSFAILRAMATRMKPVTAIIQTRQNQVASFAHRPRHEQDKGFKITLKDEDKKMSDAAQKRGFEIEEALLRTGMVPNKARKENLDSFLRKIVRDSLTLDSITWENVFDKKGNLAEWWAIDAATIEFVMPEDGKGNAVYVPIIEKSDEICYVQKINGQITAEYTDDEISYRIRNPRTDIDYSLFGFSELEMLIETVTSWLNAERYNSANFTHNFLPQGVLSLVGKYRQEHLEAFRRAWRTLTSGAINRWKVPIMALEDGQGFKFEAFKKTNQEMEFHQWLVFLTTIACAVYQIDPAEIGFKGDNTGQSGQIDSRAEKTRIDHSKDKGFEPLMFFLADSINSEIINRIDPNFQLEWVGLSELDEQELDNRAKERLSSGLTTVYEERKKRDWPSIKELYAEVSMDEAKADWEHAPLNPQAIQIFQGGGQPPTMPGQEGQPPTMPGQEGQPPTMSGQEGQPPMPGQEEQPEQPEQPEKPLEKSILITVDLDE